MIDPHEIVDIGRLIRVGTRTNDSPTTVAGIRRAARLHARGLVDITDPTIAKALGFDKLPPADD